MSAALAASIVSSPSTEQSYGGAAPAGMDDDGVVSGKVGLAAPAADPAQEHREAAESQGEPEAEGAAEAKSANDVKEVDPAAMESGVAETLHAAIASLFAAAARDDLQALTVMLGAMYFCQWFDALALDILTLAFDVFFVFGGLVLQEWRVAVSLFGGYRLVRRVVAYYYSGNTTTGQTAPRNPTQAATRASTEQPFGSGAPTGTVGMDDGGGGGIVRATVAPAADDADPAQEHSEAVESQGEPKADGAAEAKSANDVQEVEEPAAMESGLASTSHLEGDPDSPRRRSQAEQLGDGTVEELLDESTLYSDAGWCTDGSLLHTSDMDICEDGGGSEPRAKQTEWQAAPAVEAEGAEDAEPATEDQPVPPVPEPEDPINPAADGDDPAAQFVPEPEPKPKDDDSPQPVVTYIVVALIGLTALLCQFAADEPSDLLRYLAYMPEYAPLEIWRPFTCFFYFGDKISWNLMLALFATLEYTSRLELGDFRGRRSDFVALLLYCMALLIVICTVLWATGLGYCSAFPIFFLAPQLLDTLSTVFGLRNPTVLICIPLTDIAVQADSYIWVRVLIGVAFNCAGSDSSSGSNTYNEFGPVLERELMGVAAGFIAHYLPLGKGCLPKFIRRACGDEMPEAPPPTGAWQYVTTQGRASRSQYFALFAKLTVAFIAGWAAVVYAVVYGLQANKTTETHEVIFEQHGDLGLHLRQGVMDPSWTKRSLDQQARWETSIEGIAPGTQAAEHAAMLLGQKSETDRRKDPSLILMLEAFRRPQKSSCLDVCTANFCDMGCPICEQYNVTGVDLVLPGCSGCEADVVCSNLMLPDKSTRTRVTSVHRVTTAWTTACVDTGFVCGGEDEGSTDYCQRWAPDSTCQRGSCVWPASCVDAGSGGSYDADADSGLDFNTTLRLLSSEIRPLKVAFEVTSDRVAENKSSINWVIGLACCVSVGALAVLLFATARRLHDSGRSGWRLLWAPVPVVGQLLLVFWLLCDGDTDANHYGPPPWAACLETLQARLTSAEATMAASEAETAELRQKLVATTAEREEMLRLLQQAGYRKVLSTSGGKREYELEMLVD